MRWTAKEAVVYFDSKEYIDTALIPVIPLSFGKRGAETGNAHELVQLISMQLEKQFKGRILLLPPITYFLTFEENRITDWFKEWVRALKEEDFNHILFIGTDRMWTSVAHELESEYLFIPSVPLEHLEDSYKSAIIEDQVKQLIPIIINRWQDS